MEKILAGDQRAGALLIRRLEEDDPRGLAALSACLFLASDQARYVTAANLVVDGGLSGCLDLGEPYRSFDAKS